jgi:hypothetical protein
VYVYVFPGSHFNIPTVTFGFSFNHKEITNTITEEQTKKNQRSKVKHRIKKNKKKYLLIGNGISSRDDKICQMY